MLDVQEMCVQKAGNTICSVPRLEVGRGERVAVVGPNGCGKSTLLRVLGGLERATSGGIRIEPPLQERVYVHQIPYLFRGSVTFNVGYGLAARNIARRERDSTVQHWLDEFGVGHLAGRRCTRLSGGERRRVALARAFAIRADLMLLDEPLAELDHEGIQIVCRAIREESDSTIVIASPVPLPEELPVRSVALPFPTG